MESNAYVGKIDKEMNMVFNKNVNRGEIEKFENICYDKISNCPLISSLKNDLSKMGWMLSIEILHIESDLKKYLSQLAIDIYDDNGERVNEWDEPNCCLTLCEMICYTNRGHIVGIDLLTDEEFIQSLELLIQQTKQTILHIQVIKIRTASGGDFKAR